MCAFVVRLIAVESLSLIAVVQFTGLLYESPALFMGLVAMPEPHRCLLGLLGWLADCFGVDGQLAIATEQHRLMCWRLSIGNNHSRTQPLDSVT